MKFVKRILFLGLICCLGILNCYVSHAQEKYEGMCGEDIRWTCSDGILIVTGTGEMTSSPWMKKKDCWKGIRKVVISEGITSICESAFSSVEVIYKYDFLKDGIQLPDSLEKIGKNAFQYNYRLKSVTIPKNVQVIESGAFESNKSLQKVTIQEESCLTRIGEYAFSSCLELEEMNLPASVNQIGEGAFGDCKKLKDIILPNGLQKLEASTFDGCESIEKMCIPDAVTTIPSKCFSKCTNLKKIQLSEEIKEIGDSAFAYCNKLDDLSFPKKITKIGRYAFSYCTAIQELILPDSIIQLGKNAFEHCARAKRIRLSKGMTEIPLNAFMDCTSLKTIHIPDSIQKIGEGAFAGCVSLKKLVIPKNVNQIQPCHQDCSRLKVIQNKSQVTYPLSASKYVMNWYRGKEKVAEVKPGEKVKSKGKRFKLSYDTKNIEKYKIQMNGKLPTSYVYGKEPKLPKNVYSNKKNICFSGWRYQAEGKKFQTGITRTWYNARVSQFSKGLKGNITVAPMIDNISVKKNQSGTLVLDIGALLKDYLPADCIDIGRKGDFESRYLLLQVRYAGSKKMENAKCLPAVFDDSVTRIKMKKLRKGKTYYIQYKRIPFDYGGVAFETFWGETYKIKGR